MDPVVVLGALSLNGGQPSTVRVQNVRSNSFEVAIQEWAYLDGAHAVEKLSYLVAESGHFELPDGTQFDAQNVQVNDWTTIQFQQALNDPMVLSQITTDQHN